MTCGGLGWCLWTIGGLRQLFLWPWGVIHVSFIYYTRILAVLGGIAQRHSIVVLLLVLCRRKKPENIGSSSF